jgi:hypothetical protein
MMDESEFQELEAAYRAAVVSIKSYRERRNASLAQTPVARFHGPVLALYRRFVDAAGLEAPVLPVGHVLKHRLAAYGPPCAECHLPLRTPEAKVCAACGAKRAA